MKYPVYITRHGNPRYRGALPDFPEIDVAGDSYGELLVAAAQQVMAETAGVDGDAQAWRVLAEWADPPNGEDIDPVAVFDGDDRDRRRARLALPVRIYHLHFGRKKRRRRDAVAFIVAFE